jgi:hypothetical protein
MNLPRRLHALREHLEARGDDMFGDWEFGRAGSLTVLYPDNEKEIVAALEGGLLVFAGDGAGGLLALDLEGSDVERAPVVHFTSEGEIYLLGESFDDFMALIASNDPVVEYNGWCVEPDVSEWIQSHGIVPHESVVEPLTVLAEKTRRFCIRWTGLMRDASRRLRPSEAIEHRLVPGESIAGARLGMPRLELDAVWGTPELPEWGRRDDSVTAIYAGAPFVVTLDSSERVIRSVHFYAGRHRLATGEGVEPMFMSADEVMRWLSGRGLDAVSRDGEIVSVAAKLRFSFARPYGRTGLEAGVDAVELVEPTARGRS